MDLSKAICERLAALEPQSMDLLDESGKHVGHAGAKAGGNHFRLTIVSPRFSGKDQITRHRMIYEVLGQLMHRDIHALAIRAFAPDEL
ncbi:MAG: BolA family transcriptional regulator [Betaproteobacteria bacterium]|jgi:BolA protein|nr:MAG: BolA family transcriptional regulator [Betaproteobacteria bacterium]TMH78525.1 MAG: BolA family transcriptional regulator [Betaproteobacteria bacterium]